MSTYKTPDAVAVRVVPNRTYPGAHVVTIICPYCSKTHSHGLPEGDWEGGHRTVHCSGPNALLGTSKGYTIVIPTDLKVSNT